MGGILYVDSCLGIDYEHQVQGAAQGDAILPFAVGFRPGAGRLFSAVLDCLAAGRGLEGVEV